jgi:hypothetical protein
MVPSAPEYLEFPGVTLDGSVVLGGPPTRYPAQALADLLQYDDHLASRFGCTLDREQQRAVAQALTRRVALIQGW